MNFNNQNLARISLLLSLAAVFSIIGYYIPILSFLTFFVGSIFVIIGLTSVKKSYVVSSFLGYSFLIFIFLDPITSIFNILSMSMPCIVMGYMLKKPENEDMSYLIATVIAAFSTIFIVSFLSQSYLGNFIEEIKESIEISNNMLNSLNISNTNRISSDEFIELFKMLLPALVIIASLLNILISKYLGFAILKRMFPKENIAYKPFREFAISDKLVFIFAFFVLFSFLAQKINLAGEYTGKISMNITYVILYMLFIQGFAVFVFYIKNLQGVSKILVIVFAIMFMSSLMLILPFVAVLDMIFDFRKLRLRRPK